MKDDMHEIANTMLGLARSKPTQKDNITISSERPFVVCADPSDKTVLDFFAECRQEWRRVCDTALDAYLLAQVEARFRHRMQTISLITTTTMPLNEDLYLHLDSMERQAFAKYSLRVPWHLEAMNWGSKGFDVKIAVDAFEHFKADLEN